jgi:hypothetical protein
MILHNVRPRLRTCQVLQIELGTGIEPLITETYLVSQGKRTVSRYWSGMFIHWEAFSIRRHGVFPTMTTTFFKGVDKARDTRAR